MVLVSYWPLNETSGSTAKDVRGNNDGTVNGATMGANGIIGNTAYDFKAGNSEYVSVSSLPSLSSYTLTLWSNLDTVGSDGTQAIFLNNNQFFLRQDSDGNQYYYQNDGGGYVGISAPNTANAWNFWVCVFDGSEMCLYKNGEKRASKSISSNSSSGNSNSIGGDGANNMDYTDGRIADVRVYDHALTKQEIQYLYQVGSRGLHTSDKRSL